MNTCAILLLLAGLLFLSACAGDRASAASSLPVPNGDPRRGADAIQTYGCGSCHLIPGVRSADALVGPPLIAWSERQYIAGSLTNTPDNLIRWIRFPQSIEPGTAMPDMGVTEAAARDIAAYLYTLEQTP